MYVVCFFLELYITWLSACLRSPAALQKKYCEAARKRNLYLDIIHEREYDPFEFRDAALKYNDKNLRDPVKHDWDKV